MSGEVLGMRLSGQGACFYKQEHPSLIPRTFLKVVACAHNPNTLEVETGVSLGPAGLPI